MLLSSLKKKILYALSSFGYDLRKKKIYEQADDPFHIVSKLLTKEKKITIIDAGASIGETTEKLSKVFPLASIHALEPYTKFFNQLQNTLNKNKKIISKKLALSDENSTRTLNINKSSGTNSLLDSSYEGKEIYGDQLETFKTIKVKCKKLDDYLKEECIDEVELMKLDLQGSELNAIRGGFESFKKGKIKYVLCEILIQSHYDSQPSADKIFHELMGTHDYKLFNFYQHHHHHGYLCQVEALFVHSSKMKDTKYRTKELFMPYSSLSLE